MNLKLYLEIKEDIKEYGFIQFLIEIKGCILTLNKTGKENEDRARDDFLQWLYDWRKGLHFLHMKCKKCKNKKFHAAGSYHDVVEGGDDPYNYWYCRAGHWSGEGEIESQPEELLDPWENCKDFEEEK